MRLCTVPDCGRPAKYRSFCSMHYQRVNAGGEVGSAAPYRAPPGAGHVNKRGYLEREDGDDHVLVAERVLGRRLPSGAVVHHVNGDRLDNRPGNLVVCPSQSYHVLIHQRERALTASGHAGWLKCGHCKQYDAPENMYVRSDRRQGKHRSCEAKYKREVRRGAM